MHLRIILSCLLVGLMGAPLRAQLSTVIGNGRTTGTMEYKSGSTLEIESGATFRIESGATFTIPDGIIAQSKLAFTPVVAPTSPALGDLLYYNGTTWARFPRGANGKLLASSVSSIEWIDAPNPMTAEGDLIVGGTGGAAERLGIGTGGQVLKVVSGELAWATDEGGFANPMTTAADIIVGGIGGVAERLGVGTDNQVLKVVGGALAWATDSTGSGTLPDTPSEGDMTFFDGADWVSLPIGTAGQVLRVNSGATAPEWDGAPSGTKTLLRWTALSNQPPASQFATFDTRNSIAVLSYIQGVNRYAIFAGVVPEGADLSGGLDIRIIWMAATATSGTCLWGTEIERGNTDLDTDSFDVGKFASPGTAPATSGVPQVSISEHLNSEIDGVQAGDLIRVRVGRSGALGSDTMTGAAQLIAVEVRSR
jgi:hypothetical protein